MLCDYTVVILQKSMTMIKTYSEVLSYVTFEERLAYLLIGGFVGEATFGSKRWANQHFYRSKEWKTFRDKIILRDNGCDLAHPDYPIVSSGCSKRNGLVLHHIMPCTIDDILEHNLDKLLNPDNVICVSYRTHRMIHYGYDVLMSELENKDRKPNDMCPWKEV